MADPIRSSTSKDGLAYISCGPEDSTTGLICIHGWGCRGSDYSSLIKELLLHEPLPFRAIAIDLPGCGTTSKEVCPEPTIPDYADLVLSLIDELHFREVFLVGHSMGCRVCLEAWSHARPTGKPVVRGIIFLDGSHYSLRPLAAFESGNPRSQSMSNEEKAAKKAEMFQTMFSAHTPANFQTSTLAHIQSLDREHSSTIREGFINWDYRYMGTVLGAFGESDARLVNLQSTDVSAENQRIQLKTGQTSKWIHFVQEKVPRAEQYVVVDSAHFPHVDQPSEVTERILKFVRGIPQDGRLL